MMSIENPDLNDIATEIMMKLERVIKNIWPHIHIEIIKYYYINIQIL
jgi:hypothetical protein